MSSVSLLLRIRDRLPLLVILSGAGGVFVANVAAKRLFAPADFASWAYLSTLTTFFFSFSLFGTEQLIIRSARERDGVFELPRRTTALILGACLAFTLAYVIVLDGRLFAYRLGFLAVPTLASIAAIQVVHQVERTRGHLLASQLVLNGWKLLMLPLVTASAMIAPHPAELAVIGALVIGLLTSAAVAYGARHAVRVVPVATDVGSVAVPFVLSLGLMAVLNTVDRFTLEKIHSPAVFADYVYAVTILSTPFTILSSYFGFKEAVRYRLHYSRAGVRRDALRTVGVSALQVIGWSAACYLTRRLSGLTFDLSLWALLGLLSAVRCGYGILSAAMGIRGSAAAIYWSNAITAISLAAFGLMAILLRAPVIAVVAGYVLVWILRFVAYFVFLTESPEGMRSASAEGEAA